MDQHLFEKENSQPLRIYSPYTTFCHSLSHSLLLTHPLGATLMNWKYELFTLIVSLCLFLWNEHCPKREKTTYFIHKHCLAYSIHIIAINLIKFNPGLNSWVTMTLQYTRNIHKDMHIWLIAFQIPTLCPNVWISLLLPQPPPPPLQLYNCYELFLFYCSVNTIFVL